jgi:hypothetical protein
MALRKENFPIFFYLFENKFSELDFKNQANNKVLYFVLLNCYGKKIFPQFIKLFFEKFEKQFPLIEDQRNYLNQEIEEGSKTSCILHLISSNNDIETLRYILPKKINIDCFDINRTTPFGLSLLHRFSELQQILLENVKK